MDTSAKKAKASTSEIPSALLEEDSNAMDTIPLAESTKTVGEDGDGAEEEDMDEEMNSSGVMGVIEDVVDSSAAVVDDGDEEDDDEDDEVEEIGPDDDDDDEDDEEEDDDDEEGEDGDEDEEEADEDEDDLDASQDDLDASQDEEDAELAAISDFDDSSNHASETSRDVPSAGAKEAVKSLVLKIGGGSGRDSAASSPAGEGRARRKPGRPSRAESLKIEQERIAKGLPPKPPSRRRKAAATGDEDGGPKRRRGRKPMTEDEKREARKAYRKKKQEEKKAERERKRAEKAAEKAAKKAAKKGRRGRAKKVLTEEELAEKERIRKQKYEEMKAEKKKKQEERLEKNKALREYRKKRKEEEKKQREAYEKRMQELKASFLDENSHLSVGDGDASNLNLDESTNMSARSGSHKWTGSHEMNALSQVKDVTAETLFEYKWPPQGRDAEYYFLQEQVTEYLGVKSFKRRYPNLERRNVSADERDFLVEMRIMSMTQADLGLTALKSTVVLDIMSTDFYEKYDEYMTVVAERKDRMIRQSKLKNTLCNRL